MAQVIYYLEFSDTHPVPAGSPLSTLYPNGRRHRLEIIDNDASGTDVTTPNVIGDANPVQLIWDNTDDIYNSIMSSRLVMNFLSDPVKMIDVEEIIENDDPSRFEVRLYVAQAVTYYTLYYKGWITNVEFEQQINSYPVPYQLIATDLLPSLKNVSTSQGTATISPKESAIGYLENILGFLHYGATQNIRIYNNIEWYDGSSWNYLQDLPHTLPYENGFDFKYDNVYQYLEGTLKTMNARLFVAEEKFYIIPNIYGSTTMDLAIASQVIFGPIGDYDLYENGLLQSGTTFEVYFKEYTSATSWFNVTKNVDLVVPTDVEEVGSSLKIRYDSPIDLVTIDTQNNPYSPDHEEDTTFKTYNLTAYPSVDFAQGGLLFNQTYYSNDYSVIDTSYVLSGNYSFKTQNYDNSTITKYDSTHVIFDTGLSTGLVTRTQLYNTFFTSVYPELDNADTEDPVALRLEYSIIRDLNPSAGGFEYLKASKQQWQATFSLADVDVLKLDITANYNEWTSVKDTILNQLFGSDFDAAYRLIFYYPKCSTTGITFHFDNVFLNMFNDLRVEDKAKIDFTLSGSQRDSNSYNLTLKNPYSGVGLRGNFRTPRIASTTFGNAEIIAQQILNDNRQHVKRYSITVKAKDGYNLVIYPWHKIWIDYTGHDSYVLGIIDRLEYVARRGVWNIEFHIPVQRQSATMSLNVREANIKFLE